MMLIKKIIPIYLLLFVINSYGQKGQYQIPDSLRNKTFEELEQSYYATKKADTKIIYARACLQLGKQQNKPFYKASGYHFLSYYSKGEKKLAYLDSAIAVSITKPNKKYPAYVYLEKGNYYFYLSKFKISLDNYIIAKEYTRKTKNRKLENKISFNIGILKERIGKNKEALAIFKDCFQFNLDNDYKETHSNTYILTLFGLADAYRRDEQLDSASYYNRMGYQEAVLANHNKMKALFSINEGANLCAKENYLSVIDSILPALPLLEKFNDKGNIAISHYYLGKAYFKTAQPILAVNHLRRMDSIIHSTNSLMPEEREGYGLLIAHYKKIKNLKKQLYYTERLLQVDSLLQNLYKDLNLPIYTHFDSPNLLQQKEVLISRLEQKAKTKNWLIRGASFFSFILLMALVYYWYRQKQLQKRFELLQAQTKTDSKTIVNEKSQQKPQKQVQILKEAVVQEILDKLAVFEVKKQFLKQKLTQNTLATLLQTNSTYLSKVINQYKGKSFSQYLNDLRIDYIIQELQTNKKLRNYTIKALAAECGFVSSDSFAAAFYKKTGLKPSYYIKKLNSERVDN